MADNMVKLESLKHLMLIHNGPDIAPKTIFAVFPIHKNENNDEFDISLLMYVNTSALSPELVQRIRTELGLK